MALAALRSTEQRLAVGEAVMIKLLQFGSVSAKVCSNAGTGLDELTTPLSLAIFCNSRRVVELLLGRVDVIAQLRDNEGSAQIKALKIAAIAGRTECLELLLSSQSVDVNLCDEYGISPLDYSAHSALSLPTIQLYLRAGSDCARIGFCGYASLHWAVARDDRGSTRAEIVRELLNQPHGRDVINHQGMLRGQAPIHLAAEKGLLECVVVLCRARCDLNVRDASGQSPFQLAAGNQQICEVLVQHGSDQT